MKTQDEPAAALEKNGSQATAVEGVVLSMDRDPWSGPQENDLTQVQAEPFEHEQQPLASGPARASYTETSVTFERPLVPTGRRCAGQPRTVKILCGAGLVLPS
jgi:hypothetical protein